MARALKGFERSMGSDEGGRGALLRGSAFGVWSAGLGSSFGGSGGWFC